MTCYTCANTGLVWIKISGAPAVGKCLCDEGKRDPRVLPELPPDRVAWFQAKEETYQRMLREDEERQKEREEKTRITEIIGTEVMDAIKNDLETYPFDDLSQAFEPEPPGA